MGDNKYKILISAEIKEDSKTAITNWLDGLGKTALSIKNIKLDQLAKEQLRKDVQSALDGMPLEIKALKVTGGGTSGGTGGGGSGGGTTGGGGSKKGPAIQQPEDWYPTTPVDSNALIARVKNLVGSDAKLTVQTFFTAEEEERVRQITAEYRGQKGELEQAVFAWKAIGDEQQKSLEFVQVSGKYVDDEISKKRVQLQIQKDYNSQIEKAVQKADELVAKTENKSQSSKEVMNVLSATSNLKAKASELSKLDYISPEQISDFSKLENEMKKSGFALQSAGKNIQSWGTEIGVAIKRTLEWATAMTLLYGSLRQIEAGIQYISDLNKEMTSIQMVTGQSADQINELAKSYNDLASRMGTTTLEVSKGSLEFIRQGKSVADTQELLKTSLMMSKLAALDSAQATEYTTSIMNGFNLKASDMMSVLDKLTYLDQNYATSTAEIAAAMQKTAVSASQSGVSLDQLASYITVVSSISRQSAESIGTSFKTMFARLTDVKLGKALDQEGESISNVETVLKKHNISLRDANLEFRNMGNVIDEVGKRWDSFGRTEQSEILKAVAGTYQREKALVLFENYNKVLEAQAGLTNVSGLAQERYAIYLKSVEAAQNELRASWEKLASALLDSGLITMFYDNAKGILDFVSGLDSIKIKIGDIGGELKLIAPILLNIIGLIAILKRDFIIGSVAGFGNMLTAGLFSNIKELKIFIELLGYAGGPLKGLSSTIEYAGGSAALSAAKFNVFVAAIVAVLSAIYTYKVQIADVQKKGLEENVKHWKDVQGGVESSAQAVRNFIFELDKLNKYLEQHPILSIFVDKEQIIKNGLIETEKEIKKTSGSWLSYYIQMGYLAKKAGYQIDEQGRLFKITKQGISIVDGLTIATKELYNAEKTRDADLSKLKNSTFGAINNIKHLNLQYNDLIDSLGRMDEAIKSIDFAGILKNGTDDGIKLFVNLASEANKTFNEINDSFAKNKIGSEQFLKSVSNITDTYKQIGEYAIANAGALGIETNQVTNLQTALSNLSIAQSQLNSMQATNIGIANAQASVVGGVLPQAVAEGLAKIIIDSGITFDILAQNGATTSDSIVNYLIKVVGGFDALTLEASKTTNGYLGSVATNASKLQSFYASIPGLSNLAAIKMPSYKTFGGTPAAASGGGGGGETVEQKAAKEKIKHLESEKKALQDRQSEYNKYIDSLKEELKLQKEEQDFLRGLEEKNKSLAKLKSDIAILALDTSEESKAKRLAMEEEASKLEVDINKDTEDRKYQLQIDALDRMKQDYQDTNDVKMSALDSEIEKLNEVSQATGGAGGAMSNLGNVADITISNMIQGLSNFKMLTEDAKGKIYDLGIELYNLNTPLDNIKQQLEMWARALAEVAYWGAQADQLPLWQQSAAGLGLSNPSTMRHSGVDSGFVGNLKSNEEFARLMKGELVVNQRDMDRFTKTTLPAIRSNSGGSGGVSISMPLNIAGNVTQDTLPDIQSMMDKVVATLNNSLKNRGYIRNTNLVSI